MALSSSTVWEVRPAGSGAADTNGGGFVSGGTDFSQQDAPQFTGTDLASTNGTSAAPSVTSASYSFATADVGNIIQISAGSSWTTGFYQIVSVSGGAATLDRACGTSATLSGGTWAEGGALASPGMASLGVSLASPGNVIYCKVGSYLITSAATNVSGGCISLPAGTGGRYADFIGYNTSRGDYATGPTFTASGISSATLVTLGSQATLQNVILDGASLTSISGVKGSGNIDCASILVTAKNCTSGGIVSRSAVQCRATGCSSVAAIGSPLAYYCVAHDNTFSGFVSSGLYSGNTKYVGCMALRNTGASSDGLTLGGFPGDLIDRCTSYGNGRNATVASGGGGQILVVSNTIAYGNGGKGLNDSGGPIGTVNFFNCASGSNTSGDRIGSLNAFSLVSLSGNPFVNSSATINSLADAIVAFALNATAGAGAACRGAGYPANLDIGAVQSAASGGGGGGLLLNSGMTGGMRG